jgi:predicted SnoaL-like aldol condensation-catalyzing enzyme
MSDEQIELFRVLIDEEGYILFDCDGERFELSSDQIATIREIISGSPIEINERQETHKSGALTVVTTNTERVYESCLSESWHKVMDILDEAEMYAKESGN